MLKKRKILLIIPVIVIVIVAAYFIIQPRTKIQTELSDRALDYIERSEGLGNVNLTPEEKRVNEKLTAEGCFSFVLPFDLTTFREQDTCSWLYNFEDPVGRVVVRLKDSSVTNLDDLPDVRLRNDRSQYSKSEKTINGNSYYIYEKTESGYELSAFAIFDSKILTVSLTSQINRELMNEFSEMLATFEVY